MPSPSTSRAPRAVLDTNVWLDWLVFDDPQVATLRAAHAAARLAIVADADTRAELADVLARERFGLDAPAQAVRLAEHDRIVRWHAAPRTACALRCADRDDQMFLDLAVSAGAVLLVTRDRALLRLDTPARRAGGLRIATPSGWPQAWPDGCL